MPLTSVTVVVPWRGGCPHRDAAWLWVSARYGALHPTWRIVRGEAPAGEWVKAHAIASALPGDGLVVVGDADVWCDGTAWAIERVRAGAPWAVPHHHVHRLTEDETARVLAGAQPTPRMACTQRPYRGTAAGGIVVMSASTAREVPMDPRFIGWGGEDGAWRDALRCLVGMEARGLANLFHLWHPPQDRMNRHVGTPDNGETARRYSAARRNPEAMRALIAEAHG